MISDKEKIQKYENLLSLIAIQRECFNKDGVIKLLDRISSWDRAHRVGNGMNTEEEQQEIIDRAFHKLTDLS